MIKIIKGTRLVFRAVPRAQYQAVGIFLKRLDSFPISGRGEIDVFVGWRERPAQTQQRIASFFNHCISSGLIGGSTARDCSCFECEWTQMVQLMHVSVEYEERRQRQPLHGQHDAIVYAAIEQTVHECYFIDFEVAV